MGQIIKGVFKKEKIVSTSVTAIIAAAGKGERMGLEFNKIFLTVDDKPILAYTLDAFEDSELIDNIIIVAAEADIPLIQDIVADFEYEKVSKIIKGSATRQQSVYNGITNTNESCEYIVVHDAARPLITPEIINKTVQTAFKTGAAATGVFAKDTLKRINNNNIISETIDRSNAVLIQTPQVFSKELLLKAHNYCMENNISVTDDCAAVEQLHLPVAFVNGSSLNTKLTTPEDYMLISAFLTYRGDFE